MKILNDEQTKEVAGGPLWAVPLAGAAAGGTAVALSDAYNGRSFSWERVGIGAGLGAVGTLGYPGFATALVGGVVLL